MDKRILGLAPAQLVLFFTMFIAIESHLCYVNFPNCDKRDYEIFLKKCCHDVSSDSSFYSFQVNCHRANDHNKHTRIENDQNGIPLFSVKLNEFAALFADVFAETMLNYRAVDIADHWGECSTNVSITDSQIPDSVDWRSKGAVTSIRKQGPCRAGWAFGAVGVLEAHRFLKMNKSEALSVQNLIDCSKAQGNDGCNGGDTINAFKYVHDTKGINTEADYPYLAKTSECHYNKLHSAGNLAKDFRCLLKGDEEELKAVVAKYGPVAIAVDALQWDFQFYGSGIYHSDKCCNSVHCLNHAMVIVGYGTENGTDYWWVKNSWGDTWGEDGYMKIARNKNNTCGIATTGIFLV